MSVYSRNKTASDSLNYRFLVHRLASTKEFPISLGNHRSKQQPFYAQLAYNSVLQRIVLCCVGWLRLSFCTKIDSLFSHYPHVRSASNSYPLHQFKYLFLCHRGVDYGYWELAKKSEIDRIGGLYRHVCKVHWTDPTDGGSAGDQIMECSELINGRRPRPTRALSLITCGIPGKIGGNVFLVRSRHQVLIK